MNLSSEDLSKVRQIIREEIGLISPAPVARPAWKIKPQRTVQPGDRAELDALLAADPLMRFDYISSEKREALLRYGTPAQVLAEARRMVAAYGGDFYDVVRTHMADTLGMELMVGGYDYEAIARPPAPAGSIGATTDPTEILHRAVLGRDFAGSPPVAQAELARREGIVARVVAHSPGARVEWYAADTDALTVLVLGAGYEPFTVGLMPGAQYPCPGAFSLSDVCQYLTDGGGA